jgi:predicted transglutaminase-like cysteine proteinase
LTSLYRLFAIALVAGMAAAPAAASPPLLWGTFEFRADTLASLPRWENVTARIEEERPTYRACADDPSACPNRRVMAWQAMLRGQEGADPLAQLRAVNRFVNQFPYRTDMEVYGQSDYWASPLEFFRHSGDCEDYAIAKYVSLLKLGFEPEQLRLVVLRDTLRDLPHAVLTVYLGDRIYVLDNVTDAVLPQERIAHYAPYYSVNEQARWVHVPPTHRAVSQARSARAPGAGLGATGTDD